MTKPKLTKAQEKRLRKEFLKEFSKPPDYDWLQDGLNALAVWLWFRNKLNDELARQKKEILKLHSNSP